MLLKATFLLQYRRIFPLPSFQRICDVFLAFLVVWTLAGLVGGTTICLPLSKNWDPLDPIWGCEKRVWFWTGHGIVHVVTDVFIFMMPLPLLKTLPLPPLHKIILIGVFCLGFLYVLSVFPCIFAQPLTSFQDMRDIRFTADHNPPISTRSRPHLGVGENGVLVLCGSNMLDRMSLHPDAASITAQLFLSSLWGGHYHGAREAGFSFRAIRVPSAVGTDGFRVQLCRTCERYI